MGEQMAIYSNRAGGVGSQLSVPNQPSAGSTLGIALENLRKSMEKRLQALEYLKRPHSSGQFWFNTIMIGPEEINKIFEPARMRSRTTRYAVLGMSLSALLDIPAAHDFLRGLLSLVQEFESVPDDKFDRKNQRGLFRVASRARKSNTGGVDFSMGLPESGDASYLITPNVPFELDYIQVFLTTCDMLIETYRKILTHLGPSTSSASSPSSFPQPPSSSSASTFSRIVSSSDRTGAVGLSPALTDVVVKIDARLKKIIVNVTKEIDLYARAAVKRELASLDFTGEAGGDWGDWGDA
ncbi:hypothetical protein BCR35DRAFT_309309 [Leucosporidium creatinivorum]|uniref:Uncharacterized protein n=1 Tax=Leucosporidium creatinivorum TaxID=106004 RepID=A0A1Y2DJW1_9BASI|nr:hypothetical protein BCR35DRAFT_309309 [Leucosporidium creatinivorum]